MKIRVDIISVFAVCMMLLYAVSCTGQKESIGVMFYNVENLFDTINSPNTMDEEFTPNSKKEWNTERYLTKLNHLAIVIASMGSPEIVGLAEVENKNVLNDLIKQSAIKNAGYAIVHFDSPDERGIDVALLYKKDVITILDSKPIFVNLPEDDGGATRDILFVHAQFKLNKKDVYIFINHWPSRYGGSEKTKMRRAIAASTLKNSTDSLNAKFTDPVILIMGDFNDMPSDESITDVLQTNKLGSNYCDECLVNLMSNIEFAKEGSYFYDGSWQVLDQFIVSEVLLQNAKPYVIINSIQIVKNDFQLYKSKNYGYLPSRTYGNGMYHGGYSDHLPIYMEMQVK
ncbi:MAG TPA: hypothetical protein VFM99_06555 [Chitinophagales bacterium]|nr:hypothetical protein [Chitinophagales bacterium]